MADVPFTVHPYEGLDWLDDLELDLEFLLLVGDFSLLLLLEDDVLVVVAPEPK